MTAGRQFRQLVRAGSMVRIRISEMRAEERIARSPNADSISTWARMAESLDEASGSMEEVFAVCVEVGLEDEIVRVRKDLEELQSTMEKRAEESADRRRQRPGFFENLDTLEEEHLGLMGGAEQAIRADMEAGARRVRLAAVFLIVAAGVGICGILLLLSDVLNRWLGPVDLEAELEQVACSDQFRRRMRELCPQECPDEGPWELNLHRKVKEKRSYTLFQARAKRGPTEVLLWGKAYTWTGIMKSFQRLFGRAYAAAAWTHLQVLHNNGVSSAFPVAFHNVRRGRMMVGAVLLVEHIPHVEPIKKFLGSDFALADAEERETFVRALCEYYNRLHHLGFRGIPLRHIEVQRPTDSGTPPRFFLLDTDKLHLMENRRSWRHRISPRSYLRFTVRHDQAKLLRRLRRCLSRAELQICEERLHEGARSNT